MNKRIIAIFLVIGLCSATVVTDVPQRTITNKEITANLYLPDAQKGYYRATRFDWSGIFASLVYKGHTFFDQWFEKYNPKANDAVIGPVESFAPLSYDEAKPGGTFIAIGVGVLRKPVEKAYQPFRLYDIVDGGKWTVESAADRVRFTQELRDSAGYAFIYTKTVRLVKGKPVMVLEHNLKNVGTKAISTEVFDHNFPVIDKEPTGPNMEIIFPFEINIDAPGGTGWAGTGKTNGKEITFLQTLSRNQQIYHPDVKGYGATARDYDFKIQNQKTGAGMRVTADQPIKKLVFWANSNTACPEPYIQLDVQPGKSKKWNISYSFYTFAPDKSLF
jgi:hypothetical protein